MTGKMHTDGRRGITLVELLIVVSILMILVTVVVPGLMPTMESRRIREAARGVNVFLSTARVRAMDTGRVTGVMLVRDSLEPTDPLTNACTVLRQVQVPPPYAGDTLNTRVRLQIEWVDPQSGHAFVNAMVVGHVRRDMVVGGSIRINHQGPSYFLQTLGGDPVQSMKFWVQPSARASLPAWPHRDTGRFSEPLPFEILRQPQPSASSQFQLPESICIDLQYSGMEQNTQVSSFAAKSYFPWAPQVYPVYILFSPNGSVFGGYHDGQAFVVTTPIFLLVGKRDRIAAAPPPEDPIQYNWQDMNNLWVTLNPRTGTVTSGEIIDDPATSGWSLWESRQKARQAQTMGGR